MPHRRPTPTLLGAGLATLSGCLLAPAGRHAPRPEPPPAPPARTQFAELIRGPGERIAVHAAPPVVEVRHDAPAPPPDDPPPPPVPAVPAPPPDPPLVAAVRSYLADRPDEAVGHLRALEPANQELLLQLIPAVVRASQVDLGRASPTDLGLLAGQLRGPADALAARGPLGLDTVAFCRWVKGYGRFDPLPDGHRLRPGAVAELYVEVSNAPSAPAADGFRTKLECRLEVKDAGGRPLPLPDRTGRLVPAVVDVQQEVTRRPVRDYFLLLRFPAPARPGGYTAHVEVRDPATGRAVSRAVPLRVGP